jgi:hypothetical protein
MWLYPKIFKKNTYYNIECMFLGWIYEKESECKVWK